MESICKCSPVLSMCVLVMLLMAKKKKTKKNPNNCWLRNHDTKTTYSVCQGPECTMRP